MDSEVWTTDNARYIVITSPPVANNPSLFFSRTSDVNIPIALENSVIFTRIGQSTTVFSEKLTKTPDIHMQLPDYGQKRPYQGLVTGGFYVDVSANFGGEKVADNPNGDNYNAGGGAVIGAGYAKPLFLENHRWLAQASLAYRYQGGDGHNSGLVAEGLIGYVFPKFMLSAGFYGDFNGVVKDTSGQETRFNPAYSPQLRATTSGNKFWTLYARLLSLEFESKDGREFKGDFFGLGLILTY